MPNSKYVHTYRSSTWIYLAIGVIYGALLVWSLDDFFFWDTVQLGSKHAHYFFENGLGQFILPNDLDSGHIPIFGLYLSTVWDIFGKSLLVSHLAMVPFVALIFLGMLRLFQHLGWSNAWAFALVLLQPTLMAQSTLISPDVILVACFLWTLLGLMQSFVPIYLLPAMVGLATISNRGAIIVFGIGLGYAFYQWFAVKLAVFRQVKLWFFAIAGCLVIAYHLHHYQQVGWMGYHKGSPWAPSFAVSNGQYLLKNTAIVIWRLLDFGMFIPLLYLIFHFRKLKGTIQAHADLFSMLLPVVVLLLGIGIGYQQLNAHRYLLPIYLTLCFLMIGVWYQYRSANTGVFIATTCLFVASHFWVYPDGTAQGWDATLAHKPYFTLRNDMQKLIQARHIEQDSVASFFPDQANGEIIHLNGSTAKCTNFTGNEAYVLVSNIFNDIEDMEIIKNQYDPIEHLESGGIYITLFQRK